MEIAPDFFDYFEATAALLDKDKYAPSHSLMCLIYSSHLIILHHN